jgi:predicted transposase YbfD/YdcC
LDSVTTCNKGHGRVEKRTLTATPVLQEYLEWPGVQQVFQIQRVRKLAEREERETCYGITSLSPQQADAARLLELVRGHWSIENNLHGERDGAFGEDGWRVRSGEGPQVLAATRNALLMLLEERQTPNKAAAMRRFVIRPLEAFDLIASKPKH